MERPLDAVNRHGEPAWKVAKDKDGEPIRTAVNGAGDADHPEL